MVTLAETTNVSLANRFIVSGVNYTEVPAIGDGNCAPNAFALGLIDLIKRDVLHIKADRFAVLAEKMHQTLPILEERLKLYRGEESLIEGNPYTDLADDLEKFIAFIKNNHPLTFTALQTYVDKQKTREQIAALQVALAPALRKLGVEEYQKRLDLVVLDKGDFLQREARILREDGVWVGQEILDPLAQYLEIKLNIYDKRDEKTISPVKMSDERLALSEITLLHRPGHWNLLLLGKQTDGLMRDLSQPARDAVPMNNRTGKIIDDNENLTLFERKLRTKPQSKENVANLANVLETMSQNALALATQPHKKRADIQEEVSRVAKESDQVLSEVREQLQLTEEKMNELHLSKLEKELLQKPLEIDETNSDLVLARSLQNAEILSFLNKHYDVLKPQGTTSPHAKHKVVEEAPEDKPSFRPTK